jgi:hypothetical protein
MDEVASVLADYTTYAGVDDTSTVPGGAGASPAVLAPGGETTELAAVQEPEPPGEQLADGEPSSALSWWFSTRDPTSPTAAGGSAEVQEGRPPALEDGTETSHEPVPPVGPAPAASQPPVGVSPEREERAAAQTSADSTPGAPGAVRAGYAATPVAPAPPPAGARRRSRVMLLAGAALVAVVIAAAALLDDLGESPDVQGGAAPTTVAGTSTPDADEGSIPRVLPTPAAEAATPSASGTEADPSGEAEADAEPTRAPETADASPPQPSEAEPAQPSEPQSSPSPSPSPAPSPQPDAAPAAVDREAQLATAINDYYALMPGDTDAGWGRMTADYQTNHAGGFASYDTFWGNIADVAVSDVQATPPDGVVATLTYRFVDGSLAVERTAYRLVDEDGQLKIAASEVLSSRSG